MEKISLSNLAEALAVKSCISREAASNFMHSFIKTIEKGLQENGMVKVKGLGTFKLLEVSERSSVDVNTGERIIIKEYLANICIYCTQRYVADPVLQDG